MFSVLILPVVLGVPTSAPVPAPALQQDPAIRIWPDDNRRYQRGDPVKVQVRARDDGYLLVLNVDPEGRLRVLFPLDPGDDSFIRGGEKYEIPGRGGREAFVISARSGHGTVYAAVSRNPFQFDRYVRGDRWDFGALDDVRISAEPEDDLNAFVRGLARTDFDYDLLGYDIYESVVYGGSSPGYGDGRVAYPYSAWGYRGWGYRGWGFGGTSIFIGLGFGRPFFFNPFFFNPFFFDPFFFRPVFFNPFFFRPVFPLRPFFPVRSFFLAFHAGFPVFDPRFPIARVPFGRSRFGGGFFTTPWRRRGTQTFFAGGYPWRVGDETGMLAFRTTTAYQGRFGDSRLVSGQVPGATRARAAPSNAGSRRRSLDMTPGRIESTWPQRVALSPGAVAPRARRALDPERSSSMPQRVEPWGNETRGTRARGADRLSSWPSRVPEARPATPRNLRDGGVRGGYQGARIIPPRVPAARRAYDGWRAPLEYMRGGRGAALRLRGGWRGGGWRGGGGGWRR